MLTARFLNHGNRSLKTAVFYKYGTRLAVEMAVKIISPSRNSEDPK